MSRRRAGVRIELHMDSSGLRALSPLDGESLGNLPCSKTVDNETITDGLCQFNGTRNKPSSVGDIERLEEMWHQKIIAAIESQACSELENLLSHPSTVRRDIQDFADDIVLAVANAVAVSYGKMSSDFESVLQMLMFLIVEYGKPAELMMVFHTLFDKEDFPTPDCVKFFLPNMQASLLKMQKFRLLELQSILSQIDFFVGDFDWNGASEDDFSSLVHLQSIVCDFVQPFVEEVSLCRRNFDLPSEADYSPQELVDSYRNCLARILLHILAEPVGIMPVSYADGFRSYQRIVGLLGKVVPDFTTFSRWFDKDQSDHDDPCHECQIPINPDSIANLAFLVRYCDVQPNRYPYPLSPAYYFFDVFVPFSNSHGVYALQQHTEFLRRLSEELSEGMWKMEDPDISALNPVVSDLLVQASAHSGQKVRRKIFQLVCSIFSMMSGHVLINCILTLWKEDFLRTRPNALEVLVMAVKRPIVSQLQCSTWAEDAISQRQFICLSKRFMNLKCEGSVVDYTGLISSVMGVFTVILGMDKPSRTGVAGLAGDMEQFCQYWEDVMKTDSDAIKEDAWLTQEECRVEKARASLTVADSPHDQQAATTEKAAAQLAWSSLISLAVESLRAQLASLKK